MFRPFDPSNFENYDDRDISDFNIFLDIQQRTLSMYDESGKLKILYMTGALFNLFMKLMENHRNHYIPTQKITNDLKYGDSSTNADGTKKYSGTNTVHKYIRRINKKSKEDLGMEIIEGEFGRGYRLIYKTEEIFLNPEL